MQGDDLRRSLIAFVENLCDAIVAEARPKSEPVDPADWGTAKSNEVVSKLTHLAEQLYGCCMFMQEAFATTFDMTAETAAFLRFLGVPATTIAARADISRPTLYALLDEHYEGLRQKMGVPVNWRKGNDSLK